MSYEYAKQKLKSATEMLNKKGDSRRKLFDAYVLISAISDADLPNNLISQMMKLKASLNNQDLSFEENTGRVKATLDRMSDNECKKIKEEIMSFYYHVLSSR
jgi:hypothetical protein